VALSVGVVCLVCVLGWLPVRVNPSADEIAAREEWPAKSFDE
jgi:hypothetical protein